MRLKCPILLFTGILLQCIFAGQSKGQVVSPTIIKVKKTNDFTINGLGSAENWEGAKWVNLPHRDTGNKSSSLTTKMKMLYSDSGLYFLFNCKDNILTATIESDFRKLWKEDVIEIFLWPNIKDPSYFEYELSPLNFELPLLVTNINGNLTRWLPYMYENDNTRKTVHRTTVVGGPKQSNASIKKWEAEIFIPFKLLRPLKNVPPQSGSYWKANFYRIDYDGRTPDRYEWKRVNKTFHETDKFGIIIFE